MSKRVVKRIITGLQAKHHQIEQKIFQVLFIVCAVSLLTVLLLSFERRKFIITISVGYYYQRHQDWRSLDFFLFRLSSVKFINIFPRIEILVVHIFHSLTLLRLSNEWQA